MDEKSTERIEGEIEGINFATEILRQLKDTIRRQWIMLIIVLCLWATTIGAFLLYLNQYDYSTSYEATGVYALIDSNGNIVAQDVTDEQLKAFTEWWDINGDSQENNDEN